MAQASGAHARLEALLSSQGDLEVEE